MDPARAFLALQFTPESGLTCRDAFGPEPPSSRSTADLDVRPDRSAADLIGYLRRSFLPHEFVPPQLQEHDALEALLVELPAFEPQRHDSL